MTWNGFCLASDTAQDAYNARRRGLPLPQQDERLNLLLETLAHAAISVELQPTLTILLDSLHKLVPFDGGGIVIQEAGRGVVRARATRGYPEALEMPAATGLVGEVLRTGQSRIVRDVTREVAYVAVRPSTCVQLTVPLASPRGILGAIVLESDSPSAFDDQDLALVTRFGQQATVVIERALLHEQLLRQSRLDRDMEIARDILKGLSPESAPMFPGMDVFGRSLTAEIVGGDAFDFIPYPDSQVGISISDAKGKGLPGALLAVAHRAMLHALVSIELRLRSTFGRMSDVLARSLPPGNFITTFYGIIDVTERRMVYVNAGHPPPLVIRANGNVEALTATGPALGFPWFAPIREAYAAFGPGDGLVLFTDGITEAGPSPDEFFEVAGIQACVGPLWSRSAADVCQGILDEAARRSGGAFTDDATVVVVKFDRGSAATATAV
jgi:sigma-B regulation protein RsbU (phosphoserine phosphatase)